jgi:hypothetical protein
MDNQDSLNQALVLDLQSLIDLSCLIIMQLEHESDASRIKNTIRCLKAALHSIQSEDIGPLFNWPPDKDPGHE